MKKLLPILLGALVGIAYSFTVDAQGLSKAGKKVEFTFPDSITANQKVLFPTYEAQNADYASTLALTVNSYNQLVVVDTTTNNMTVNLTIAPHITSGANLYVYTVSTGSNRTITWGTNIDGVAVAQDSAKAVMHSFIFDGSKYLQVGRQLLN